MNHWCLLEFALIVLTTRDPRITPMHTLYAKPLRAYSTRVMLLASTAGGGHNDEAELVPVEGRDALTAPLGVCLGVALPGVPPILAVGVCP